MRLNIYSSRLAFFLHNDILYTSFHGDLIVLVAADKLSFEMCTIQMRKLGISLICSRSQISSGGVISPIWSAVSEAPTLAASAHCSLGC